MSFLTVIEQDAVEIETVVVAGLKTAITYVDNVVVTDLIPVLEQALLAAIEKLGQEAVAGILAIGATKDTTTPPAAT